MALHAAICGACIPIRLWMHLGPHFQMHLGPHSLLLRASVPPHIMCVPAGTSQSSGLFRAYGSSSYKQLTTNMYTQCCTPKRLTSLIFRMSIFLKR